MLDKRVLKNRQIFFNKNFILVGILFGLVSNSYAGFRNNFYASNMSKRRVYNSLMAGVYPLQIGENVQPENPLAEICRKHDEEIGRYTAEARELLATVAKNFPFWPPVKREAMAKEMLRQRVVRELREESREKEKVARQEAKAQGFEGDEGYRRWLRKQKRIFTFKGECDPALFLRDNKIREKKSKQEAANNRHDVLWQETIGTRPAVRLQNPPADVFAHEGSKGVLVSVDLNLPGSQKLLRLNRSVERQSPLIKQAKRQSSIAKVTKSLSLVKLVDEQSARDQLQVAKQVIKQQLVATKPSIRQSRRREVVVKSVVEEGARRQSAKLVTKQSAGPKPQVIRPTVRQQSVTVEQSVRRRKSQPITRRLAKSELEPLVRNLARDGFGG